MNCDSFIFLCLVLWKIGTFIVPCILGALGFMWLLEKWGIDL